MNARVSAAAAIAIFVLCFCVSCGSESRPRSFRQMNLDRNELPALYLTGKSRQEIIRPANHPTPFYDEESGEIAYRAYDCRHPNCPMQGKTFANGRPYLYILDVPRMKVKEDGTFYHDESVPLPEGYVRRMRCGGYACPECLKTRDLDNESDEVATEYSHAANVPYVLPESAERIKELDEEEKKRREDLERRKDRPVPE